MRILLRHLWEVVSSGYWFVPSLMLVCAVGLAFGLLWIDRQLFSSQGTQSWLYGGGPDGARVLLSTVAGSVITVAGVVFSITIAALTQASQQFGPRLLRNFMRDTGNQVVLGTFVATFLYCLLILRTVRSLNEGEQFVPHASVTMAVLLAVASIAVLIYFIHHVSMSLQAPAIVAAVTAELKQVLARISDDQRGTTVPSRRSSGEADGVGAVDEHAMPSDFDANSVGVASTEQGYVQAIDFDGLVEIAESRDLVLRLNYRPGDYVIECNTLLRAWPAERCGPELTKRINSAVICGQHGTPEQDVEHAVRQIVEIAVRALSPGTNDPFTAINCIDALGSVICRIVRHGLPGPNLYDSGGRLRVVTPITTFDGVLDLAFNQIRQNGRNSPAVMIRMLEVIGRCAEQLTVPEQRQSLLCHAEMIYRQSAESIAEPRDRQDVAERWSALNRKFSGGEEETNRSDQTPATANPGPPGGVKAS